MDERAKKVLSSLEAQCSKREYCSSDILRKALEKLEGDREAAEEVVASLVENKFVDDLRYAEAFAREKSAISGWGPVKIRYALGGKGISRETITLALGQTDPEKSEARLRKLLETKKASLEGDPQARLKLIKFALSRGYEYDEVSHLI